MPWWIPLGSRARGPVRAPAAFGTAASAHLSARRRQCKALLAWLIIVGTALRGLDSAVPLLSGWVSPTALGTGYVIAQAVAVLAELQFVGLRRSQPAALPV